MLLKRTLQAGLLRGAVATGAACLVALGLAASPAGAAASRDSDYSHANWDVCLGSTSDANGNFAHEGDRFRVADMCKLDDPVGDAVILGDIEGNSAPEIVVWDTDGGLSGEYAEERHNVKEGTRVNIRVCMGDEQGQRYWGCGSWKHGYA